MRWLIGIALVVVWVGAAQAAEDGEATKGVLLVTVRAEGGTALAGARVVVWNDDGTHRGTADETGQVRIEDLEPGAFSIVATAKGRCMKQQHGVNVRAGEATTVEFQLAVGIPFVGRVVDLGGQPVGGADVQVLPGGTFEGYGESFADMTPYFVTGTDDAGHFSVDGIPPERVGTVVVRLEGYEEARVCVRAVGDVVRPQPLEIRLVQGGEVAGTVTSPAGEPAADAAIFVVPAEHEPLRRNPSIRGWSSDGSGFAAWTARSDAEGRYRVIGLPLDASYVVLANRSDLARSTWSAPFQPTREQRSHAVDLVLRTPAALRVRIQPPKGRELPSLRASLGGHMSGIPAEDGTEKGVVLFRALWPGTHLLEVAAQGYFPYKRAVTIVEGQTLDVTVDLDPGVAIRGRVVDGDGDGVAEVRVSAECKEEAEGEGWHALVAGEATTDDEGRFLLSGLRRGRHELKAMKAGFGELQPLTVTAPASDVVLKGVHLGTLCIRFVTPDGEPVTRSRMVWRRPWPGQGGSGSSKSAPDGVFRFLGFRGRERLTFDFDGYVRVSRDVDIQPGEDEHLGTVTLEVGATLRGRVVDLAGTPVRDAVVDHGGYTAATTDEAGAFILRHLPRGVIALTVDAEGFLWGAFEVELDAEAPTLVVARGTWLEGVVRDAKGEVAAHEWFDMEHRSATGTWEQDDDGFGTEEDGTFEVRVRTGPCRIIYRYDRKKPPLVLATIDGKEGETRKLRLVLDLPGDD